MTVTKLFPDKEDKSECLSPSLEEHFKEFLDKLDYSLETFHELNAYEKYELFKSLVSFTHTSLDAFLKIRQTEKIFEDK